MRSRSWSDESACRETARRLAAREALRDAFIELHGPLGAGKTTFVRHLLHGLGVEGAIKSPTYALLEPYRADAKHGDFAVSHFDFYRFDDPNEWQDAGFREIFAAPGLKLVEWPEKAADLLPRCDLRVFIALRGAALDVDGERAEATPRDARFEALSARGVELLP